MHVPRLDVTFDRFRLRDADLVRQGAIFLRREYVTFQDQQGMDISGFLQDMFWEGVLGKCRVDKDDDDIRGPTEGTEHSGN